jgi:hypothetical protein
MMVGLSDSDTILKGDYHGPSYPNMVNNQLEVKTNRTSFLCEIVMDITTGNSECNDTHNSTTLKTHILCCVFLRLVYPMLPVSLDCPFFIAPSVFSNIYFVVVQLHFKFEPILT